MASSLQEALAAIRTEKYAEAHQRLLRLAEAEPGNSLVWFLLAWTAPNCSAATRYFTHLCELDPGNPLARDGLAWSQTEWEEVHQRSSTGRARRLVRREPVRVVGRGAPRAGVADMYTQPTGRESWRLWGLPFFWILVLYLLGVAAAEWATAFFNPQLGLVLHGSLLALIFLHAALGASGAEQKMLFTLALAPIIRLQSLSMPLAGFPFSYWYAIVGLPLFLSAYLALRLTGFSLADVGITGNKLPLQALVGLSGLGLGWVEYQILKPAPLVGSWRLEDIWLTALILFAFTGFLEELIFRGLMQRAAQAVLGSYGMIYVALMFAVLHIGYRSFTDFAFVLGVGLAFGWVARWTGSLWGVALAHGLTNITLYMVFPLW